MQMLTKVLRALAIFLAASGARGFFSVLANRAGAQNKSINPFMALSDYPLSSTAATPGVFDIMRVFEDMSNRLIRSGSTFSPLASVTVPLDVKETEKAYEVVVDVPGVKKQDITVDVREGVLNIMYERKATKKEDTDQFHRVERVWGHMQRSISLPRDIKEEDIKAECKEGILTIEIPKAANAETTCIKKIEIK